jgi:hypothetical protein
VNEVLLSEHAFANEVDIKGCNDYTHFKTAMGQHHQLEVCLKKESQSM